METRIKIMDLDIDMISTDSFIYKIKEYLTDDHLNVILLATTKMLEETAEDEEYRELLSRADLILPGEDTLLSMHHVDVLEVGGMVINYKCLEQLLDCIKTEKETIYVVARSEIELDKFTEYCKREYSNIQIVGKCIIKTGQNDELVINEINSLAPDILILTLDPPLQERWIMKNDTKLNAKLCICVGSVMNKILEKQKEPPTFFRVLGLKKLYEAGCEQRIKKIHQIRIFKRKVANYKNKKGE